MTNEQHIAIITEVINTYDPEHLLLAGAPDNEYEYEVKDIAKYDITTLTVPELADVIYKVFKHWLQSDLLMNNCIEMAKAIKSKLNKS